MVPFWQILLGFSLFGLFQSVESVPVGAAVTFRNVTHFLAQFFANLTGGQTPAPVDIHGAGGVHTAAVVQTQPVLNGDDAGIGCAHHSQVDKLLVHLLVGGVKVSQVGADMVLVGLVQTVEPAGDGLVVVGAGVDDTVVVVVVGQVVVGTADVGCVKGKLDDLLHDESG